MTEQQSPEGTGPHPANSDDRNHGRILRRAGFVIWVSVLTIVLVSMLYSPTVDVGPGTIDARIRPALSGTTELSVPPLGAVRAGTHLAPVTLGVELRQVDVLDVVGSAEDQDPRALDDPLEVIEAQVRDDIGPALVQLVLRMLLLSCLVGAGAALAFPGRRTARRIALGALIGPATVTVMLVPAAATYDAGAFDRSPELVGELGSAPQLLARVGSLETRFGSVESRVRVLSAKIADLYSAAITEDIAASDGEVVLLHVSDLHLNTVGLALARQLARSFDVDAVIDTGDITSFGFEPESAFLDLFDRFGVPYYLVAGNHDSASVRERLAGNPDVTLLDGDVVDVDGITILGMSDPTDTALRQIPRATLDRTYRSQFATTTELVAEAQPDLLMVHNPVQARPAYGKVPTIAAGHLHRTRLEVVDGSIVAIVGSSGATGVGDLLVDSTNNYDFELLRYRDGVLVAVDQLRLEGAAGDFVLHRNLIDDPDDTTDDVDDEGADEPSLDQVRESDPDAATTTTVDPAKLPGATDLTNTTTTDGDGP